MKTLLFTLLLISSPTFAAPGNPKIVFLGDSLTEGYGISKSDAFPFLIEKNLQNKNITVTVVNSSQSGSTSASGESRLQWILKSNPDILFLALGANDGLRGLPTEAMKTNLEKVIRLAQAQKVRIIFAGMKIPMNYGADYRNRYEKVFNDLAKQYKLTYIPFLLDGVATLRQYNISDGIHPNEKGHKIMAEKIQPFIEKEIKGFNATQN